MADFRVYPRNPLRTVEDYRGDILQNQMAQENVRTSQLQQRSAMQQFDENAAMRNALAQLPPTATPEERISAIERLGTKSALDLAAKYRTQLVNARNADTERRKFLRDYSMQLMGYIEAFPEPEVAEQVIKEIERVSGEQDPAGAEMLRRLVALPPDKRRQAFAQIRVDPEKRLPQKMTTDAGDMVINSAFDPASGTEEPISVVQKRLSPFDQVRAADQLVVPGPEGPVPNEAAIVARERVAEAQGRGAAMYRPAPAPVVTTIRHPTDPNKSLVINARDKSVIGESTKPTEEFKLSAKDRANRETKFPQMTLQLKQFNTKSDELITDLETLKKHPGLDSITGIAAGRIPGITSAGRAAEALHEKIQAKGQFGELQNMRNASPTGGALGQVSDAENKALRAAFASLQRTQDAKDIRKAIDDAVAQIRMSKQNMQDAYDMTYEYRLSSPETPAEQTGGGSVIDYSDLPEE